ncbi:MAG: hypothetical protein JWP29_1727 [Rhodoferax sp.]|nr:hypothetical protein [Rhodoferax sp.]
MNANRRKLVQAAAAALALPGAWAYAQPDFPNHPIRLVISFPAGSGSDIIARYLGQKVSATLGQPIIVESKAGAQGAIAAREVAKSKNDGYTLLLGTNSTHAANIYMMKDLSYDPVKDFTPITQLTANPLVLVVRSEMPVNNLQEFLKYGKERQGKLNYGTGNSGGLVAAQLLKSLSGLDAVGVNYAGTAQAVTDLIGGRLDFMVTDPMVTKSFVDTGKLRALAVTTRQRLSSSPDVVPMADGGLPGYEYASWVGLFGPAGMQAEVVQKINQAFLKALTDPETEKFFAGMGMIAAGSAPDVFQAYVLDQIKLWGRLTKEAGVTPL